MNLRLRGLSLLLALPLLGGASALQDEPDRLAAAKACAAALDWEGCARLMLEDLKRRAGDAERHELYGRALHALDRRDEAAHHIDLAIAQHEAQGRADLAKALKPLLAKCDEHHDRRDKFLAKAAKLLIENAEQLFAQGHEDRALEVLGGRRGTAGRRSCRDRRVLPRNRALHDPGAPRAQDRPTPRRAHGGHAPLLRAGLL
jgi:hypothetical protein